MDETVEAKVKEEDEDEEDYVDDNVEDHDDVEESWYPSYCHSDWDYHHYH